MKSYIIEQGNRLQLTSSPAKNVLGTPLQACCHDPKTGFMRDGFCHSHPHDPAQHIICAIMTADFLQFTQKQGNDLSTALPSHGFPGLKPGDRWCLCASRWQQALHYNVAPPVILNACEQSTLTIIPLTVLQQYAYNPSA